MWKGRNTLKRVGNENKKIRRWIIVGEGETDFYEGGISWKSVMGRSLLGKKLGDFVTVLRPKGEIELEIININSF